MDVKVVKGKIIHGDEHYFPGSIVRGLSAEDHARVIECGIAVDYSEGAEESNLIVEESSEEEIEDSSDDESGETPRKKKK